MSCANNVIDNCAKASGASFVKTNSSCFCEIDQSDIVMDYSTEVENCRFPVFHQPVLKMTWRYQEANHFCENSWAQDLAKKTKNGVDDCKLLCVKNIECTGVVVGVYKTVPDTCILCTGDSWHTQSLPDQASWDEAFGYELARPDKRDCADDAYMNATVGVTDRDKDPCSMPERHYEEEKLVTRQEKAGRKKEKSWEQIDRETKHVASRKYPYNGGKATAHKRGRSIKSSFYMMMEYYATGRFRKGTVGCTFVNRECAFDSLQKAQEFCLIAVDECKLVYQAEGCQVGRLCYFPRKGRLIKMRKGGVPYNAKMMWVVTKFLPAMYRQAASQMNSMDDFDAGVEDVMATGTPTIY